MTTTVEAEHYEPCDRERRPEVDVLAATEHDSTRALALLIFVKNTRLEMTPGGLERIYNRIQADPEWAADELEYMVKTIRSSWEFLDVTFMIRNVSRACAQQITRTRFVPMDGDLFGSYAMQSQRVSDMSGVTFHVPATMGDEVLTTYRHGCERALEAYANMVGDGASKEDARNVLPIGAHCNLVAKYNLRTLTDLIPARTSYRAQGEYQQVATQMRQQVVKMWPWSAAFFRPRHDIACRILGDLDDAVSRIGTEWDLSDDVVHELRILIHKAKDQIEGGK